MSLENSPQAAPVRRVLNRVYAGALYVAAFFFAALLVLVVINVIGRMVGFNVRGADAYAGYSMAAAAFLALGHTLKSGEHIRVTLLLERLSAPIRSRLETATYLLGIAFSAALVVYSFRLVWQSHLFHDVSQSMDRTPLWIPQIGMAIGSSVFAIAMIDEFCLHVRRRGRGEAEASHMGGFS